LYAAQKTNEKLPHQITPLNSTQTAPMSNLVIVESPAKCAKIQGFLGFGWKVIASLGHIRHLKEDLKAIGLDKDFVSEWEWMREKAQTMQKLKDAAKEAQEVYLAADDDREGELIAYSVCLLLKRNPETTPRLVFHEITESAIKQAVANPRRLDMNKVHAAEARAILDMMVGFTMSPLLWNAVGPALSAGRCQTPALRLVADRETEIKAFKPTSSWKVHGQWTTTTNKSIQFEATMMDALEDKESALNYLELCHTTPTATITKTTLKPWSEASPIPLITSTLQQQASSLYRIVPKETMKIAQKLYEAGHITYMRTDKAVLSEEAIQQAKQQVTTLYGSEYCNNSSNPMQTKQSKSVKPTKKSEPQTETEKETKAQEAHEAIRPTHFELKALSETEDWSSRDRNVYALIWLRAMQSVMAPAKGQQRTIQFIPDVEDAEDFPWSATWRKTDFQGWRRASTKETDEPAETDADQTDWLAANALKEAATLKWQSLLADPHETKAPARYTEATLIKDLEGKGIGRPSTFASLISTILDKEYVTVKTIEGRQVSVESFTISKLNQWPPTSNTKTQTLGTEKDRLVPTPLGLSVLDFLLKQFEDLFAYGFTAKMEQRLDAISEGTEQWKQILNDTWNTYKDRYEALKNQATPKQNNPARRREFANGLLAVLGKKGPLLLRESPDGDEKKTVFYGWPDGIAFPTLTEEEASTFVSAQGKDKEGEHLGDYHAFPILRKKGKFGMYAEWNGKRVSCQETDTFQAIAEKIEATRAAALRQVGAFEIRNGPYGPYMFKHAVKGPERKFVSVPPSISIETVTEQELQTIFQAGLQQKAHSGSSYTPRGGRGGRGGWRGRGSKRGH
jgi:DNA topoisomerase-1